MTLKRLARRLRIPALLIAVLGFGWASIASGEPVNRINSIKSGKAGIIRVEIQSHTPFLRSDLPVLRIKNREYTISEATGDPNSLTFSVPAADFANKIRQGDPVAFQWGVGDDKPTQSFGNIDKRQLDK